MLRISLQQQTLVFLYSCLVGVGLGMLYDVFRILRIAVKTPPFIIFIEDVIYFTLCGVISFLFIFQSSSGVVRGFILAGELLGAVLYYCTVGVLVIKVATFIINLIKRILNFIYKLIFEPIISLFKLIGRYILKLYKIVLKYVQKICDFFKLCLKVIANLLYNVIIVKHIKKKSTFVNKDGAKSNENG